MCESDMQGLQLPEKDFEIFDKEIIANYGESICTISQKDPYFAFQAIKTGLTAAISHRRSQIVLLESDKKDSSKTRRTVIDRKLDGETAYISAIRCAMGRMVDEYAAHYDSSGEAFTISVLRKRGQHDDVENQELVSEIVAVIPAAKINH